MVVSIYPDHKRNCEDLTLALELAPALVEARGRKVRFGVDYTAGRVVRFERVRMYVLLAVRTDNH